MTRAALLALLLLPGLTAGQGWSQFGGGPGHSSVVELGRTPLDVLAHATIAEAGHRIDTITSVALSTPSGVVLFNIPIPLPPTGTPVTTPADECQLTLLTDLVAGTTQPLGDPIPCANGVHLLAYLPSQDALLVGVDGASNTDLLRAYSATSGEPLWAINPMILAAPQGGGNLNDWHVDALAYDETLQQLIAYFGNDNGNGRLSSYALSDRSLQWSTVIAAQDPRAVTDLLPVGLPMPPPPPPEVASIFSPFSLTLVPTGVVVIGTIQAGTTQTGSAMVWLDLDGRLIARVEDTTPTAGTESVGLFGYSSSGAANGGNVAAIIGRQLYIVDPRRAEAIAVIGASLPELPDEVAAPAWSARFLFAPGQTQAFIYDAAGNSPLTTWNGYKAGIITQVILNGDQDGYALVQGQAGAGQVVLDLVRVQMPDGINLQRIPIPLPRAGTSFPQLLALGGQQLLMYDDLGNTALLGHRPTDQVPMLAVSSDYPATSDLVELSWSAPAGAPEVTQVLVGWGDGLLESFAANATISRAYFGGARDVTLRTTLLYADNTTATAERLLHLGQSPPQEQSLIAVLFSPANQNYTFFGIGILLTLATTAFAAVGALKGRRRLDKQLRSLDQIRLAGRSEPLTAIVKLHTFREARSDDLAKGHLDNSQYSILEGHAHALLELLRQRILGSFSGRVSESFQHALDTALADGAFDDAEANILAALVASEKGLSTDEKGRLCALIGSLNQAL